MQKTILIMLFIFTLVFSFTCKNQQEKSSEVPSTESQELSGEGEESGQQLILNETYDNIRKGVRLVLSFDKKSSSFVGTVENVTNETIKSVRVEVHLSNGTELGPTKPVDLASGEKADVKLSAEGQSFEWWKAHPEAGSVEEHSHGEHDHGEHK